MPVLFTQILDVSSAVFEDPQPEQSEYGENATS